MSIVLHLIAWNIMPKATREDKVSTTLSIAYPNLPLAIVVANNFFSPMVAVMVVLYDIPRNLMLIPFKYYVDKSNKKNTKETNNQTAKTTVKKSIRAKVPKKVGHQK